MRKKEKACYICGRIPAGTVDHIPGKNLFVPPLPGNLITVPCCKQHNNLFSKDEEYFRDWAVGVSAYYNPEATQIWRSKMNRPRIRKSVVKNVIPVDVLTESGVCLGQVGALTANRTRIDRVLDKIARGLYYHHYDCRLDRVSVETYLNPANPLTDIWKRGFRCDIGGGVFSYWYVIADKVRDLSLWWLVFYKRVLFVVTTVPISLASTLRGEVA